MIHIDTRQAESVVRNLKNRLTEKQVAIATSRAINHTIKKAQTGGSKAVRIRYNFRAAGIKKRLPIHRASRATLTAIMKAETTPTPLINVKGARQTKRGVSVAVIRGKRKLIRSAFKETVRGSKRGVFARGSIRKGNVKFRHERINTSGPDLPIVELTGPSIASAMQADHVTEAMESIISSSYPDRLTHEIQRLIN